ncbi:MAG: 50S ribosomal protein L6 [Bacteroidota bacterium]
MSRIGNMPVTIPDKVQVDFSKGYFHVKGPKGELRVRVPEKIEHKIEDKKLIFSRISEEKKVKALHGLTRSLTANAVEGVSNGFSKTLQIEGVGFRAELKGAKILLSLGFSHPVLIIPPDGINFEVPNANTIKVIGIDKQVVGQIAAKIRKLRPPEPYKGKGIRYEGEYIRRKAGKTAA